MTSTLKSHQRELVKREKDKTISDIAIQVAHDIRSPVMALNAIVESVGDNIDGKVKKLLSQTSTRINGIANDLLKQSKIRFDDQPARENISELIRNVIREKQSEVSKTIVIIDNVGSFDIHLSNSKSVQLQRILSNLINNSIEASSNNVNSIEVKLTINKTLININVNDAGIGINESVLQKVAQRGFTFGKSNGNGLGLAYAREAVESWGGKFQITSVEEKGTSIILEFPI